jgi:phosphinothricin acetyltransferase
MGVVIETLRPADWEHVRRIYLDGIATGLASFETEAPSWEDWNAGKLAHSRFVARLESRAIAWAALSPVSKRPCYAGVAEASIYVAAEQRGRGVGKALLHRLVEESECQGIWSLYGATFAENSASIQMQLACGFRIVGRRERIAQLHGVWHDTVITERRSAIVGLTDQTATVVPDRAVDPRA